MAAGQSAWLQCKVDCLVRLVILGLANIALQAVGLNNSLILGNIYGHIAFYMVWNFGDTMDHIIFYYIYYLFSIDIVQ